jgi:hypothetical protein
MIIDFDSLGINQITHIKRFYLQDNPSGKLNTIFDETGLLTEVTTDWVSPYGILAVNNPVSSETFTVGGNHGTDSAGGFATARHIETLVYADGKLMTDGEIRGANKVVIRAIHHIAASNVIDLTTGAKRDCVKEIVTYTVTPRHIRISVELEALEQVRITRYFGFQASKNIWGKELYFMEDTIQQIYDIETDTSARDSGTFPDSQADRFVLKKDGHVLMGYAEHRFGIKTDYIANGQPMIYLTEGTSGKVYKHLVKSREILLSPGQSVYIVGGYIIAPDMQKSVATTACSYIDSDGRKVYVLDFFTSGETYFLPDKQDINNEIEVIKKSNGITIDNYITGKGIKITSSGYGQVFFKLK